MRLQVGVILTVQFRLYFVLDQILRVLCKNAEHSHCVLPAVRHKQGGMEPESKCGSASAHVYMHSGEASLVPCAVDSGG